MGGISSLLEDTLIEGEPRKLAIEEAGRRLGRDPRIGLCRLGAKPGGVELNGNIGRCIRHDRTHFPRKLQELTPAGR